MSESATPEPNKTGASTNRPWLPYVLPMALFVLFTFAEGYAPTTFYPWLYTVKVAVVTVALALCFPRFRHEIKPTVSVLPLALLVGLAVCAEWVLLNPFVPPLPGSNRTAYNPFAEITNPFGVWAFLGVRFFGLALLVPVMEEVFWRSFGLRFASDQDRWQSLPVGTFTIPGLLITSSLFALAHPEWLVAFICAVAYAFLLRQTRSLFAVIVAHAVTNAALGVYVLLTGNWHYW